MQSIKKISKREAEVLQLIALEHTTQEIANKLFLSKQTIISHRKNLMRKLEVRNVAGMVREGFQRGILSF